VAHPSNLGERLIKNDVRGQVRGGPQNAFDNFAVEVGHDQVGGFHSLIGDAAWFDDDQRVFARNATGIAESEEDKAASNQFEVSFEDLFPQTRKEHAPGQNPRKTRKVNVYVTP